MILFFFFTKLALTLLHPLFLAHSLTLFTRFPLLPILKGEILRYSPNLEKSGSEIYLSLTPFIYLIIIYFIYRSLTSGSGSIIPSIPPSLLISNSNPVVIQLLFHWGNSVSTNLSSSAPENKMLGFVVKSGNIRILTELNCFSLGVFSPHFDREVAQWEHLGHDNWV